MFDNLSARLQEVFRQVSGRGKITEENITEALRQVRRALLEADVNLKVVKKVIAQIKEKALGQEVLKSLTPGQQFIKIVHEELITLLGGERHPLDLTGSPPAIVMLVGLQGSGKTSTCGKLALYLRKQGRRPLMVAADIYRPAAIQQLQVLGKQIQIPVFTVPDASPLDIAKGSLKEAEAEGHDVIILDTAGRLHIDEVLMNELIQIKQEIPPNEVLLVVDAMIGQDAVRMAQNFDEQVGITGIIMTKLDGDTRGGAALSVKEITGQPIKFAAMGEKVDALENFYPDRIAGRILGMGDVVTLVEKAQKVVNEEEAKQLEAKFRENTFTLEDFLAQMKQIKKIGSLEQIIGMIPGLGGMLDREAISMGEKQLKVIESVIQSMTPEERRNPDIINHSRKLRIANGCGNETQEVSQLLKQFKEMRKMIKKLSQSGMFGEPKRMKRTRQNAKLMKAMMSNQFPMPK